MERLNDIMMRTAQRRQQAQDANQQATQPGQQQQDTSAQGQGQSPRQPLPRRAPLPEQTARQGQYPAHPASPAQSSRPGQPQSSQQFNRQGASRAAQRGEPGTRYAQPQSPSQGYSYGQRQHDGQAQRRNVNERSSYYSQPTPQEPPASPMPQNTGQGQMQRKPRITGDYYDSYEAVPQGDVQDEWDDDSTAMRYGDWEGDESGEDSEAAHYTRPSVESFAPEYTPPQGATWAAGTRAFSRPPVSPLATRQLPSMQGQEPAYQSPLTRRDPHLPLSQTQHAQTQRVAPPAQTVQPAPPAPPSPQPPQQEAQRYHRHTQPLNPKAIAGMNRSVSQERSPSHPPAQRPSMQRHQSSQPSQPPQPIQSAQPAPLPSQANCPLCKGAGYLRADVPYGHPNFGKPIACECKEAERAEKRRMHLRSISNLDAFRDKSFKNFNPHVPGIQEAYKIAQAYANDPDGWLLLIGRNGCGKTHLAAAIANQHLAKGSLVLFATVPDLLDHLRATFAPSSTVVYDQLFSSMREAELLILDDLGAEQNSPWASEKLFQLLNYRYNSRFPTVITTNKMRLQAVDERIRSRLTDTSLVIEVSMDRAQDYRPHNPQRLP